MKNLKEADLKGKTVFYRPDYNVPLKEGEIQDPYRIDSTFDTLNYLIEQGAKIVIGVHIGQPKGLPVPELETRPVAEYLADKYPDHTVQLAHDIAAPEVAESVEAMQPGDMLLLPNLRFYPGEEENDPEFAALLAALGEVYVNDAFAVDHRAHASLVGVPALLPHYPGFLLQKELDTLGSLLKEPAHPFVVVMGGAKVSDKIEVIRSLAVIADTILIGGAMANTFLLAQGQDISESKAEPDKVDVAKALLAEFGEKLVVAADYVKDGDESTFRYLDIGEKAIEQFEGYLKNARTILWNGSLGYTEDPKYAKASTDIATFIGGLAGVTSIVAGGDTVEMITELDLHDKFTFISTGGGAALDLLAGKELPAVTALEK
jgi:phosphoglycerate kinase